jgi:Berberine and berberine like
MAPFRLLAVVAATGEMVAEHVLVAPGEASVRDEHYGGPRPAPQRAARPKTPAEKEFCALGPVAEAFITGAAAAGNTRLGAELADLSALGAAHGRDALVEALHRAVAFGRWRAADVRSILAAGGGHVARPVRPGRRLPSRVSRRVRRRDHQRAAGGRPPGLQLAKSEFFDGSLPADAVRGLVAHFAADRVRGEFRDLEFIPWGAAHGRVPPAATAFAHRGARFMLKHTVQVGHRADDERRQAAHRWVTASWAITHPYGSGAVYVNYADPALPPWDRAYHGANLDRLLTVKAHYDPADLFQPGRR